MTEPIGRLSHVVIDCLDPKRLADFWSKALNVLVAYEWHQYVVLQPSESGHPSLAFQQVGELKVGKNRAHLDLMVGDLDAAQSAAVSLGARFLHEHHEDGVTVRIMADPEDNEFCLVKVPPAS
jgi:catechol 2,3-dioxygenase-like lactoylglutathione lyase family enzyme